MLRILLIIVSGVMGLAGASASADQLTEACVASHAKAVTACKAQEQTINVQALTIVSEETRERVVAAEQAKLEGLKQHCEQAQEACALICDENLESASLDGADISGPIEMINDCRLGEVHRHLQAMEKKRTELLRVLGGKPEVKKPIKSADVRY